MATDAVSAVTDAVSGVGGPTGRVVVEGRDRGAGFALAARLVVTANHVIRDRGERPVAFIPDGGTEISVSGVEGDEALDVAVLHLDGDVGRSVLVGRAAERAAWRVETRPKKSDPVLSGSVTETARRFVNARGEEAELLQLHVDQELGDYGGYSGSSVVLESQRDAVIGVLVEQQRWRLGALPGQPVPAANVLYATPIEQVIARFAIENAVRVARPHHFNVPRPPGGLVERPDLLNRLLDTLENLGAGVTLVRGLPGMGKTVLAGQAAYHSRIWRAYPGGVMEHVVGQDTEADEILNELRARLGVGSTSLADAFSDEPTVLILDDVWSAEIISRVRENLPDQVALLATTRGVSIAGAAVVRVDELTPDEAIELLARATPRDRELEAALGHLADVLGRWPLLVDLAARHLHLDDVPGEDAPATVEEPASSPSAERVDLIRRAADLAKAFEDDPTLLDEPDSRRRSFDRMLRRSLERLSDQATESFAQLAVYPADADLTGTLLGDLWELDPIRTERTIVALARVGLATLTRRTPLSLRLHDLVTAWLHHEYGSPEAPIHSKLHRRSASPAITSGGTPRELTADRAAWLAYHLCRTDTLADPAALLNLTWRNAYRAAAGSDALYLAALREIARHYATRLDTLLAEDEATGAQLTAWIIKAALFHAHLTALVGEIPPSALATQALLGQPEAAAQQAASSPDHGKARAALSAIILALHEHGSLTPQIVDLTTRLAGELQETHASGALEAITQTLASSDSGRALAIAGQIRDEWARARALAGIAPALTPRELDRALAIAEQLPDDQRSVALAGIAKALVRTEPDRALAIAAQIPNAWRRAAALGGIAEVLAPTELDSILAIAEQMPEAPRRATLAGIAKALVPTEPDRALAIAEQIPDGRERGMALARIVPTLTPSELEHALAVAEQIPDEGERDTVMTMIAKALAPTDPDRSLAIADQLSDENWERRRALAAIAEALAPTEPNRARAIAEQLPEYPRRVALARIAPFLATTDPDEALAIAEQLPDKSMISDAVDPKGTYQFALIGIVKALAPTQPDRAVAIAERFSDERERGEALAGIAQALAPTEPDRAQRLVARVLAIAEQMPDESRRGWALASIAEALTPSDPEDALAIAEQIPDEYQRGEALAEIVQALNWTEPHGARRLVDRALAIAKEISHGSWRNEALARIARTLAQTDPDRALAIAEQLPDESFLREAWSYSWGVERLAGIIQALAPTERDRARRVLDRALAIAGQILDESKLSEALGTIAQVLAPTDLDGALAVVERLADDEKRSEALGRIAQVVAPTELKRVLAIARQIPDNHRGRALAGIAQALAGTEPDRALAIAEQIRALAIADRIPNEYLLGVALAAIAPALAPTDPDRALAIAGQIPDYLRGTALAGTARALAPSEPDRALAIAQQIPDHELQRDEVLTGIAEALAPGEPDRALAIVEQIPDYRRREALARIAEALVGAEPNRALAIAEQISEDQRGATVAEIVRALAPTEPARALAIVERMPDGYWRIEAFGHLAGTCRTGTCLLSGVSAGWSDAARSLTFVGAFIASRHLAEAHRRLVAAEVLEVLQWFRPSQRQRG